ncbi:MAG: hypothetical protein AAF799_04790 [Myxococcota bacterium]
MGTLSTELSMRRWSAIFALALAGCEINPLFDPDATAGSGTDTGPGPIADSGTGFDSGGADESGGPGEPGGPRPDPCAPLPPPTGTVITVGPEQAAELPDIVEAAPEGSTVVLTPGTYLIDRALYPNAPGITVRSSTGQPEDVLIDGQRLASTIFTIQQSDVMVAELTLARPTDHLVHVTGSETAAADRVQGYRLHLIDPIAAAFKVNPSYAEFPADDGTLACSTIELTDEGRQELGEACDGVSAVAGFATFGWTIRDNYIEGMWCSTGYGGAGIRFLETSAHTVVEHNVVQDCTQGIILGLWEDAEPRRSFDDSPCGDSYFDHQGGVVRNNMVMATGTGIAASEVGFDTGIGLWNVCGATVVHNTVVSAIETYNSIEYRFPNTQARVVNNLVTNEILDRDDAGVPVAGNLLAELNEFVDPLGGDVHLIDGASAIDAGVQLGDDAVLYDIDGQLRDERPDIGADER